MSDSAQLTSRWKQALRCAALALGAVLVWFGTLGWPIPMGDGLDASWNFVLGYARLHHLQFGREIVFTYGPWGYLTMPYTLPELFWDRVVWEFLFKAGLAVTVALCAARLPWWRAVLLVVFSALMLSMFSDASYSFVLAVLLWSNATASNPERRVAPATSGAVLGFFALQKFTFFVFTAAGVGGVCCVLAARRQMRPALWLAGSWLLAVVISWLAAAQSLSNLIPFIGRSLAQSAAYQQSMVFDEPQAVFWCGIATLLASGIVISVVACSYRNWSRVARTLLGVLAGGLCFLVWKQSFIRADGHVMGLFLFAGVTGLALRHLSGIVVAAVATFGFWTAQPGLFAYVHHFFQYHVQEDLTKLGSLAATQRQFVADTQSARAARQLPRIRERVGNQPVDVFGFEQVTAYWNELDYRPRPAFQSYQVTSPSLTQLNADFYVSNRAPEFVLARLGSIDGRYPPIDDARALRALLTHYEFEFEEQGWLLLHRRSRPLVFHSEIPIRTRVALGEPVTPPPNTTVLWAEIDLRTGWLGMLRTFLYKPQLATLTLSEGPTASTFRLVTDGARGGFLLAPTLKNTEDLKQFFTASSRPLVSLLSVTSPESDGLFFKSVAKVELVPLSIADQ